ncbi:MAG: 30S ribosomal protein S17 [Nitrospira sp.]|nr:30S ribosomal protein S17 [Nitrospira sp.]
MTKKLYTGKVVSDKMDKTVVVAVTRLVQHPHYKKIVKRVTRFKVHDEKKCQVGDIVNIIETRPLSKDKRWMVVDIVEKAARGY